MHAIAPFHLVAFYNEAGESLSLGENPFRRGIREAFVDKLDAMRMFVRVVDRGTFSAVAKELGIGQPAVSKQISALENELGAQLIHRSSRAITLTEAGRDFYASALHILDDFENATSRIGRGQTAPKGLIRITVPPTFARLHMVSKLPSFFAAYPDMAVEMAASESPTTIIEDGFDLAIHSGDLPDSNLVARKFAQTMIILVATPQYLARYGSPESPDDLTRHRAVVLVERGSVQPWTFGSKRVVPTGAFWNERYRTDADGCAGASWHSPGASLALRRRTERGHRYTSSDAFRTNRADPCAPACQPPALCQSTDLHRAPGKDFRALLPVQSAAQIEKPSLPARERLRRWQFERNSMIDHIILTVSNVERSLAFYEAALAPLNIKFFMPYKGRRAIPICGDLAMEREHSSGSNRVSLNLGRFIGDSWLRTMPKSMSSTRRQLPPARRLTFRRARGWSTTPATTPQMSSIRTGIRSRLFIRVSGSPCDSMVTFPLTR
jgi:DNA-binding transcriptional LysR family regulator